MQSESTSNPVQPDRIGSLPKGRGTDTDTPAAPDPSVPGTDGNRSGTDGRPDAPERVLEALRSRAPCLAYELAEGMGLATAIVEFRLRELLRAGLVTRSAGLDGRWRWRAAP